MKICKGCRIEKELSEFSFNNPEKTRTGGKCKLCVLEYWRNYREINKEKVAESKTKHYLANKSIIAKRNADYNETRKNERNARAKLYRDENPEKIKESELLNRGRTADRPWQMNQSASKRASINKSHHDYIAKRTAENPMFLKARQMRAHLSRTFKRAIENEADLDRYSDILGCTIGHWVNHITSQFKPGMSLKDRSSFQLDHIQPISSATDEESLIKLHHWTNYQPLFKAENAKKGKKIIASLVVKSRVKKLNVDSNNYISI